MAEEGKGPGRPTDYRPQFAAEAQALCEAGATDMDLADHFGVTRATIRAWRLANAEFRAACKLGKDAADDRVEASLYHRAVGYTFDAVKIFPPGKGQVNADGKSEPGEPLIVPYREHVPPDVTAGIFWLKNRRSDKWRDRSQHEHSGPDGGPIKTEGGMSDREAARVIARFLLTAEAAAMHEEPAADTPIDDGQSGTEPV